MEAITYKKARRVGVLAYAIFFEESLAIGKLLAGILAFMIATYFADPWMAIYILAGLFTLLYLLKREQDVPAKVVQKTE